MGPECFLHDDIDFCSFPSILKPQHLLHDDIGHPFHLLGLPGHRVVEWDVKEAGKTLKQCGFSTKVNVAPGEQSLSGWPFLAPDIAPVPVAAREPGHLLATEPGQLHPPLSATPFQSESEQIWTSCFRYLLNDSRPS